MEETKAEVICGQLRTLERALHDPLPSFASVCREADRLIMRLSAPLSTKEISRMETALWKGHALDLVVSSLINDRREGWSKSDGHSEGDL